MEKQFANYEKFLCFEKNKLKLEKRRKKSIFKFVLVAEQEQIDRDLPRSCRFQKFSIFILKC